MATTAATAARDQRRRGREKRRDVIPASGDRSAQSSPPSELLSEGTTAKNSVREGVKQTSPGAAALFGAAVGVLTGALVGQKMRNRGNEISGEVAVHLLNRVELLTIRLQARQARRAGPAEIDVHHIQADASSRP